MRNRLPNRLTAVLASCLLGAYGGGAEAAFQDPSTADWGGWTRGSAGSLYAGWDVFTDDGNPAAILDTTPDVQANVLIGGGTGSGGAFTAFGPGLASVAEAGTPGTMILGSGNIYNFAAATAYTVSLDGHAAAGQAHRVALQVRTVGMELDYGSVMLNGVAGTRVELHSEAAGGGPGAVLIDNLFLWNLGDGLASYDISFAAPGPHVSLDALTVDVAPVPLPAAAWLFGSALAGLVVARRKAGQRA